MKDNAFLLKGLCDEVSKMTPGYSGASRGSVAILCHCNRHNVVAGSDLRELCSAAMQECVAEDMEDVAGGEGRGGRGGGAVLNMSHFQSAAR